MKAVKIIIIVLAPIALIYGVWSTFFSGGAGGSLPGSSAYADVATGEVRSYASDHFIGLPGTNERDGKPTVYPVFKDEDGVYRIAERYRSLLRQLADTEEVKVDLETYEVLQP